MYRIFREEVLTLRSKSKRKKLSQVRIPDQNLPSRRNECWAMDFVSDQLYNGKKFRSLTLIDVFTRECLSIYPERSIMGEQVSSVLDGLKATRGLPKRIKVDNGPEFISRSLDVWSYLNHVHLDYSRAGTPTDNAHIESFNGSFRDEFLNVNWFMSLEDAREKIETWRMDYNEYRPHSGLTHLTPAEFAGVAAI